MRRSLGGGKPLDRPLAGKITGGWDDGKRAGPSGLRAAEPRGQHPNVHPNAAGSRARGDSQPRGRRADYDDEARKLFEKLGLPPDGSNRSGSSYNDADVVYRHPNGACFLIGNQSIASNKEELTRRKIFKIVNCQEPQAKNVHENDPHFEYYRGNFSISLWQYNPKNRTPEGLLEYMGNLFQWVDERLNKGHNVMVHCLAGAHRAGTAGTSYVMYKAGLDKKSALTAVQACRPFVDPIYDFKDLLEILEVALRSRNASRSTAANAGVPRAPGSQSLLGR